jgi:ABC-type Fe3+/spermidine/putrescine transport system ATPase subunit
MCARWGVFSRFVGGDNTHNGETLFLKHSTIEIYRGEFLTLLGASAQAKQLA